MQETIQGKQFTWYHITKLAEEDVSFLRESFQFNALDVEDVTIDSPIPKLDVYKHYVFAVFHIPIFAQDGRLHTDTLAIFFGADYIVTVTKRPIAAVEKFFSRAKQNPKFRAANLGKGAGFALYKLLHYTFYHTQSLTADLARQVGELEERVYKHQTRETTRLLAFLRRNVLFFRTGLDPERSMVTLLGNTRRPFIAEDLPMYFDDLRDLLDSMWTVTENLKQVVDGLFDVNESLLAHKTNHIVTIFTAIAAALMPPTLVAGIYGMNVTWLPFINQPWAIVFLFVLSLVSFFGVIYWMRRE